MNYNLEKIAAEILEHLRPQDIPPHSDELFLNYAALAISKGRHVDLEDIHDAWVAWMTPKNPEHPALVPFKELETVTQNKDAPYLHAVRLVAAQIESAASVTN